MILTKLRNLLYLCALNNNIVRNMKRLFLLSIMMLQLALCVSAEDLDSLYSKDLLKPGTEAPNFKLKTPEDKIFELSSQRGRYVVIDFWATWCKDCRQLKPEMDKLSCLYNPDSVAFVGVSFDTDKEVWAKYISENEKDFAIQVSELKKWKETTISKLYGINWIPSMYLIDPSGKVALATTDINKLKNALQNIDKSQITKEKQNWDKYFDLLGIKMPQYKGGSKELIKFLSSNLQYPKFCQKNGVEAKVLVKFRVGKDGHLDSLRIAKTEIKNIPNLKGKVLSSEERDQISQQCKTLFDNEALRVCGLMPAWTPGTRYDRPVNIAFTLPVSYRLK